MRKIVVANDHAAVHMKEIIVEFLKSNNFDVINMGTDSLSPVDYPDYAYIACEKVLDGTCEKAILMCGTGVGMSICANKIDGIRAALCENTFSAKATRQHNDANVLCLGARVLGIEVAKEIIMAFLTNDFIGKYHINRLDKIRQIEEKIYKC